MTTTQIVVLLAVGGGMLFLLTRPTPYYGSPQGPQAGSPSIQNQLFQQGLQMLPNQEAVASFQANFMGVNNE